MKIKVTISIIAAIALSMFTYARPPRSRSMHHAYPPHSMHHHHHGSFWTGVGIGLVGSSIFRPLPPPPPPVPVAIGPAVGRVWVPPVYQMRPVYDAFGNIL